MEVKMPYVKRMGLGGIMLEVIMVGCFWLLLADFKIGMVMGTIVTASVIMMSVIDRSFYILLHLCHSLDKRILCQALLRIDNIPLYCSFHIFKHFF